MNARSYAVFLIFISILYLACNQQGAPPRPAPAQSNTPTASNKDATITVNIDKSPLDMSYYPDDFPQLKMSGSAREPLVARVIYSRPKKEGRVIFGDVLKYGSRWRLGANEATEIEFFKDVTIQNKVINKDRYVIYCIPFADKWTIVFNTDLFTWGLKIDSTKDVHRFDAVGVLLWAGAGLGGAPCCLQAR